MPKHSGESVGARYIKRSYLGLVDLSITENTTSVKGRALKVEEG